VKSTPPPKRTSGANIPKKQPIPPTTTPRTSNPPNPIFDFIDRNLTIENGQPKPAQGSVPWKDGYKATISAITQSGIPPSQNTELHEDNNQMDTSEV
jgi:hypothetical protein